MALASIKGNEPNPAWEEYDLTETYDTPKGPLVIVKTMPHGFRRLMLSKGELPEKYNSDYTTLSAARTAKDQYIEELKRSK